MIDDSNCLIQTKIILKWNSKLIVNNMAKVEAYLTNKECGSFTATFMEPRKILNYSSFPLSATLRKRGVERRLIYFRGRYLTCSLQIWATVYIPWMVRRNCGNAKKKSQRRSLTFKGFSCINKNYRKFNRNLKILSQSASHLLLLVWVLVWLLAGSYFKVLISVCSKPHKLLYKCND